MDYLELQCPDCSWRETCDAPRMVQWLAKAGKTRPGRSVDPDLLPELFRAALPQLTCPECGRRGLRLDTAQRDDWPDEALCTVCRRPIPPERLEAVPGTKVCARCQQHDEQGTGPIEVEYCPKCGSPMALRLTTRAGLARYEMVCTAQPACRRGRS